MKKLDSALLDDLKRNAQNSPRGRTHHTLHEQEGDPVQRMCVAINPGSYIQPHRHASPAKWELFIILQGAASILLFDESASIINRIDLEPNGSAHACEIPEGVWHTLVCSRKETILVEIKPGPYEPLTEGDFADWAPKEGEETAAHYEKLFLNARIGDNLKRSPNIKGK